MPRDHARAEITLNVRRDRVSELVVERHERSQSRIFELRFPKQRLASLVSNIQFLRPVIIMARARDSTLLWKQSVDLGQLVRY